MWNLLDGDHLLIVLQFYLNARRMMIESRIKIKRLYFGIK